MESNIPTDNIQNVEEAILYEEIEKNRHEENMENSQSDVEYITNDEFLLDCARYGEVNDLLNLLEEDKKLNINYKDFRGNTALRMQYLLTFRYGLC